MQTKENNYAFIDSQNLHLSILRQGWKLNFQSFRKYLEDKYYISKAFLCIGYIHQNRSLYNSLKKYGYTVIFKPTVALSDGQIKGNVDTEIVLHALIEMNNYNKAIIVGNDGDFHCLVEYLLNKNKLLHVLIPDKYRFSSLLRKFGRSLVFLNDLKQKLELKEYP